MTYSSAARSAPAIAAPRRVVVTGLGAVTTLGGTLAATRAALADGRRAARSAAPGHPELAVAAIEAFEPRPYFRQPKALKLADRKTQLAVAAAAQALVDAGLSGVADNERENWAVVLGCSALNLQVEEIARALANRPAPATEPATDAAEVVPFAERVLAGLNPLWLLINLPNMVGAHVGIQLAANGPNETVTGDAIAGLQAIGEAWLAVASGDCDLAIAGGADSPLDPFDLGCLAPRPGSAGGRTLAEGAAVLVLEERGRALARGAAIRGEIHGFASGPGARAAAAVAAEIADDGGEPPTRFRAPCDLMDALGDSFAASGAIEVALRLAELADAASDVTALVSANGTAGQGAAIVLSAGTTTR